MINTDMWSVKIRMTRCLHAGNYKLRGQRVRREVERRNNIVNYTVYVCSIIILFPRKKWYKQ